MKKLTLLICLMIFLFLPVSSLKAEENNSNNNLLRLGVMKFFSRAEGVTDKQAEAIGDIFTRMLANSKAMIVVERDRIDEIANEHKLTQAGRFEDDAVIQLGKLMSCQYMLLGAVTNLERKTRETDLWLISEKHQEVTATIDVRIVDVATSKIILSFSESGSSSQKGSGFNFYGVQSNNNNFSGIEIPAISEAVLRAIFHIREALAGESVQVIDIANKEITINAGENWGINAGNLFRVYSEGKEVFNVDGSSMGKKLTLLAVVKVTDVQKELSTAQVIKNGGSLSSIRRGSRIQPISRKEADNLIKDKTFAPSKNSKNKKRSY